jgi:hypothetical protein
MMALASDLNLDRGSQSIDFRRAFPIGILVSRCACILLDRPSLYSKVFQETTGNRTRQLLECSSG